ncbi:MAG: hypothetical protein GY798_16535 [Hyphomicrobiales bacterium]|nr:hypothetical protein [Hyphomicrobiales bacterium]
MSDGLVFVYVATGEKYVEEARRSADSCREQMPSSRIALFTPDDCDARGFDEVVPFGSEFKDDPFELKIAGIASACETVGPCAVFLDSDTYVIGDVTDLGEILDRFDLAAAHAPIRLQSNERPQMSVFLSGAPRSFPEFNTGVIAFRCSAAVQQLFLTWLELYREQLAKFSPLRTHDQPSFREVTYKSDLQIATLPLEYNCVFWRPMGLCGAVKILHGRGNYPVLAEHLNETLTFRAVTIERYLPNLVIVK